MFKLGKANGLKRKHEVGEETCFNNKETEKQRKRMQTDNNNLKDEDNWFGLNPIQNVESYESLQPPPEKSENEIN